MKNLPVSSILSSSTRLKEARVEGRGLFLCPLKGMLSPVSLPAGMALPLFTESRPAFLPRFIEKKFDKIRRKGIVLLTHGVVAQLGERLNGIQEVVSSILSSSTRLKEARVERHGPFLLRIPPKGGDEKSPGKPGLFHFRRCIFPGQRQPLPRHPRAFWRVRPRYGHAGRCRRGPGSG